MAEKRIKIIGCGPGGADYLTPAARTTAEKMTTLAGASRLFELFPDFKGERILYKGTEKLLETIEYTSGMIGILVSGDTSYFSLAESIVKRFGIDQCELIPGISSIQVALARLGLRQNTARIISAHAGIPEVSPESLTGEESILILGGNPVSNVWLQTLAEVTSKTHTLYICLDLTLETEQIVSLPNSALDRLNDYLASSRLILVFTREPNTR